MTDGYHVWRGRPAIIRRRGRNPSEKPTFLGPGSITYLSVSSNRSVAQRVAPQNARTKLRGRMISDDDG
jgi:hypothetical protein